MTEELNEDHKQEEGEAQEPEAERTPGLQPVWTFRGYELRPSEFTTAMVHFMRAEVTRANVWRQRLDATTNWAVLTTGAVISFAFSTASSHHLVIILNVLLVTLFLFIESRRYRYYELFSSRVRLMETDFIAAMLVPPFHPAGDWAETLAENLLHPHFPISIWEALGRRLRRNYLWIYSVILLAWLIKIWLQDQPAGSLAEYIERVGIASIPGWVILLATGIFYLVMIAFSLATIPLQAATGEVLPRFGEMPEAHAEGAPHKAGQRAWFRPKGRRRQLLTFVITDKAKAVSEQIFKHMNRGVTALPGRGMYTGQSHTVLMCALTVTEVAHLKAIVQAEDPNAFVVVSPAQEIFGRGFLPLEEEEE